MGYSDLITALFCGNLLTISFVWGIHKVSKGEKDADVPWLPYAAVTLPILLALASAWLNLGPPQPLSALVSQ